MFIIVVFHVAFEKLIRKLDDRASKDPLKNKKYTLKRGVRIDGSPSQSQPPDNTPLWMISEDWRKGL